MRRVEARGGEARRAEARKQLLPVSIHTPTVVSDSRASRNSKVTGPGLQQSKTCESGSSMIMGTGKTVLLS